MRLIVCLFFLLLLIPCFAIDVPKEPWVTVFTTEASEGQPKPILAIEPEFPQQALRDQIEGRIVVEYKLNGSGRAQDIDIIGSYPKGIFDQSVIAALKTSTFEPPSNPNNLLYQQIVVFVLIEPIAEPWKSNPSAPPASVDTIDEPVVPLVTVSPAYPSAAFDQKQSGSVTIEFTIDPHGSVTNPTILESSSLKIFDEAALRAIQRWKFKPIIKDGERVPIRAVQTIDFNYELITSP